MSWPPEGFLISGVNHPQDKALPTVTSSDFRKPRSVENTQELTLMTMPPVSVPELPSFLSPKHVWGWGGVGGSCLPNYMN